jgi:rhodanese-related sulfurtransferase
MPNIIQFILFFNLFFVTKHAPAKSSCVFVNSIAASIPAFRKALNKDANSSEDNGSPVVLVVCASAHRSTDVINSMSFG